MATKKGKGKAPQDMFGAQARARSILSGKPFSAKAGADFAEPLPARLLRLELTLQNGR